MLKGFSFSWSHSQFSRLHFSVGLSSYSPPSLPGPLWYRTFPYTAASDFFFQDALLGLSVFDVVHSFGFSLWWGREPSCFFFFFSFLPISYICHFPLSPFHLFLMKVYLFIFISHMTFYVIFAHLFFYNLVFICEVIYYFICNFFSSSRASCLNLYNCDMIFFLTYFYVIVFISLSSLWDIGCISHVLHGRVFLTCYLVSFSLSEK